MFGTASFSRERKK